MPRLCAAHMTFKFMSKERELVIFNIICRLGSLTAWPRASGSYAKALKKITFQAPPTRQTHVIREETFSH